MVLRNRFMRSATYESLADENGFPTSRMNSLYETLAKSQTGLIVSGGVYTEMQGRGHKNQLGLINDEQMDHLALTVDVIHKKGGLFAVQLNHAGVEARKSVNGGHIPEGPSKLSPHNSEMSHDTVMRVVESFIQSARRAYAIGVDAVQLHAAHGYLLGEFLSPIWNKRTDKYGVDQKGRFEIVRLIIEGIRSYVPSCFPVFLKINGHDVEPNGVTLKESIQTAQFAQKCGVDALEISGGSGRKPYSLLGDIDFDYIFKDPKKKGEMQKRFVDIHFKSCFNLEYAEEIKKHVSIPIISVGGFRTLAEMENAVNSNKCDIVSMSRPFIREPNLVENLISGATNKSTCVSCNRCFFSTTSGKPMRCLFPY